MKNYIQLVFSDDGLSCCVIIGKTSSEYLKYRDEVSSIIYGLRLLGFINDDQERALHKIVNDSDLAFQYEDEPNMSVQDIIDIFVIPPFDLDDYLPKHPEFVPWIDIRYGTVGMIFLPKGTRSRMVVSKDDAMREIRRLYTEPHTITPEEIDVVFDQMQNSSLRELGTIDEYIDIIKYAPDDISPDEEDYEDKDN